MSDIADMVNKLEQQFLAINIAIRKLKVFNRKARTAFFSGKKRFRSCYFQEEQLHFQWQINLLQLKRTKVNNGLLKETNDKGACQGMKL